MQAVLKAGIRSYTSLVQAHAHSFFQIVLPSRGALDIEIAGQSGRIDRDWAAVIGVGDRHAFSAATEGNQFFVLDVNEPERTSGTNDLLARLAERRYLVLTPAAHHLMGYAEQTFLYSKLTTSDGSRLTSLWLQLLLEALSPAPSPVGRPVRALARARAHIDRFYDQRIRTSDLSRIAGLSASRFHQLFQEQLGTTPRRYVADVRLRHALALLATTGLSIAEIAVRTGHADQSALTRHLRRARGVTPAAYRRTARLSAGAAERLPIPSERTSRRQ
jgi:transcriptional regulator GlxA family with amidase domain